MRRCTSQLAPWRWLNDLPAWPPLNLWLPFPLYRAAHRAHHHFEILTEPWRDPESFYVDQATWRRLAGGATRAAAHNTLVGRLVLGPFLVIGQFFWAEAQALPGAIAGPRVWLWHLPGVARCWPGRWACAASRSGSTSLCSWCPVRA